MSATYVPPAGSIPTLDVPDLGATSSVHMVGAGGAGMNGIARLLLARGISVTGCDLKASRSLDGLRALGAPMWVGHDPSHVGRADAVVISSAIPAANAEVAAARASGVRVLARAQVLAALASGRRTAAVAGTHGKTTTTSMLSVILEHAGAEPTYVIGGDLNESGSGARHGTGEAFVAEADESDGSFLLLRPDVAVVTNVESDHLDFYRGGLPEIVAAFATFMRRSAMTVICVDDDGAVAASRAAGSPAVTYGLAARAAVRLSPDDAGASTGPSTTAAGDADTLGSAGCDGGASGTVALEDGSRVTLRLRVPGVHNLLNATAALSAARHFGVEPKDSADALAAFTGVHRRFERRGAADGATFVDDYAHHPTELRATLDAAARLPHRRLIAVFQPHRYSRTAELGRELGASLAAADVVVVTDVYGAGEAPIPGISGRLVADGAVGAGGGARVVYLTHRSDVAPFLADEVREGDLVLTLGAGDITAVADEVRARMEDGR